MKEERLIVKHHNAEQHYDLIEGDSKFAQAVNEKMRRYWVETGHAMPIETAAFGVLADLYNKLI